MCGYGMQQLEESSAHQDVFTVGCLEKIIWWARNNLLLVGGLLVGLLLLEVSIIFDRLNVTLGPVLSFSVLPGA